MIYLDNAATTKVSPDIAALTSNILCEHFANPSAVYLAGMKSEEIIDDARRKVASCLSVRPSSISFTSGGTEANHIGLCGLYYARRGWSENIVMSGYEHPSVRLTLERLATLHRLELRKVMPKSDGTLDANELLSMIDNKTAIVSVMQVNNETGALFDISKISNNIRQKNSRTAIFVDGVQGYLKFTSPVELGGIDGYSASGHKLGAPKGVGMLYLREGVNYEPVMVGGGQENGIRSGTENTAFIAAFGEHSAQLKPSLTQRLAQVTELRKTLLDELEGVGYTINSPNNSSPYILNLSFEGTKSAVLQRALDEMGLMVSSGASCSKGGNSKTLTAMSLSNDRIEAALRISFSPENTAAECKKAAEFIGSAVNRIRGVVCAST